MVYSFLYIYLFIFFCRWVTSQKSPLGCALALAKGNLWLSSGPMVRHNTSNQILAPKYQFKYNMVFLWPSFASSHRKRRPKEDHDALKLILWSQNLVASVIAMEYPFPHILCLYTLWKKKTMFTVFFFHKKSYIQAKDVWRWIFHGNYVGP